MKNFPNVHNITLDSLEAVSDNIIKCFKGTLTLPTSFIVDKTFIDKVSEQEIIIMVNEINDNYNFADGVFYESGYSEITGIVPQSETVVIRDGVTNIDKDLFTNNKKIKSLISIVETIEESESIQNDGSIFDDNSKVTVSVPPTYKDDSFGGTDVVKEEEPNDPNQPDYPDQPPNPTPQPDDTNVGLIVGVVIAVVVVVAAIVVGVIFFIRKRKQEDTVPGEQKDNSPEA